MQNSRYLSEFNKLLNQNAYKYHTLDVFRDFCRMATISLSSPFYGGQYENEYMSIIKKYDKKEAALFPQMLSILIEALEQCPHDFLGEAFMSNDMGSSYKGQFFTPQHICDFMTQITISDLKAQLNDKEFVTLSEPACGAGAMVVSVVKEFIEAGLNHSRQLYVVAKDIDPICADMAYIQLSLLGVPATVVLGDTLANTCNRALATPVHFIELWEYRLRRNDKSDQKENVADDQLVPDHTTVLDSGVAKVSKSQKANLITPSLFDDFYTIKHIDQVS